MNFSWENKFHHFRKSPKEDALIQVHSQCYIIFPSQGEHRSEDEHISSSAMAQSMAAAVLQVVQLCVQANPSSVWGSSWCGGHEWDQSWGEQSFCTPANANVSIPVVISTSVYGRFYFPAMFMYYAEGQEPFPGKKKNKIKMPTTHCKPPVKGNANNECHSFLCLCRKAV